MGVPCVRVEREDGEAARRALAEHGLVAEGYEITAVDGWLYIPVSDPGAVSDGYEVVDRDVPARDTRTTPDDLVEFDASYERLGDIVIVDEDDPGRAHELADAVMASDLPAGTVIDRASEVKGDLRVRDWERLAGDGTETVHREYGYEYALDVASVYFSPRLATERRRVTSGARADERAFDMFAGVGPFAIPLADRGAEVVAVDLNPEAVAYLRENARRNGVADRLTIHEGDAREVAADYPDWADRIVMNLPHSADVFLGTAVSIASDSCLLHYYDIQPDDDPYGPGERAVRAAAGPEYDVTVETRRTVRSYAPHELNVVLDVRLERA